MKERTLLHYLMITLKGVGMGAADVVPGVSGGTIAFITGIYEELISSLNNINLKALKLLKNEGLKSFWKHVNGNFFVALFLGIGISIVSLAKLVTHLLENYPVLVWSFFFGLVIASSIIVAKSIKKWNVGTIAALIIGIAVAGFISSIETTAGGGDSWYILLSGAIAICAMILPGISGAFILVLLGSYEIVIGGLKEVDLKIIGLFVTGCLIGLLAFSKVLKFLFENYKNITLATLCGFLIGSLYKIWPWKNRVGGFNAKPLVVHSSGKEDFMMTNVLPDNFVESYKTIELSNVTGNANLSYAILFAIGGLVLILLLEKFAPKEN